MTVEIIFLARIREKGIVCLLVLLFHFVKFHYDLKTTFLYIPSTMGVGTIVSRGA